MRAVIGQFSGLYSPAQTAKIYFVVVVVVVAVAKLLRDLSQNFLSLYSN